MAKDLQKAEQMPLVSVVVPNYNHGSFLKQRLDSILEQSYPSIELILLDDASTDDSAKILGAYRNHPQVAHIEINHQNSGSSVLQWKKGISLARGTIIWIAESDDYADPEFLKKVMPPLIKDDEIVLSYCRSIQVDVKGRLIKDMEEEVAHISDRWKSDFVNEGKDELANYFCLINTIPNASSVVFRKSALINFIDQINDFSHMRLVGDKMFYTYVLLQGKVAYVSQPLNYFRKHGNTVRTKSSDKQNLADNFAWYGFLNSKIEIPAINKKRIRNRLFGWWFSLAPNGYEYFYSNMKQIRERARQIYTYPTFMFFYLYVRFKVRKWL